MPGKRLRVSNPIKISLIGVCLLTFLALSIHWSAHWNAQRIQDNTLFDAVVRDDTSAVQKALQAGANVNTEFSIHPSSFDNGIVGTPLSEASCETMPILLDWGANVNQRYGSEDGTLLHYAVEPAKVRMLLQYHANPNLRDKDGNTPLDQAWAKHHNHLLTGAGTKDIEQVIELLKQAGAKTSYEIDSQDVTSLKTDAVQLKLRLHDWIRRSE